MTAQPGDQVMISRGFLCSIPMTLLLSITAGAEEEIVVEPTHATIESKEGQRLRVVFATEDRPALTLNPKQPRDLGQCDTPAVDGHDRRTFTGARGLRSGHIAGDGNRGLYGCRAGYVGSHSGAASIEPSTSRGSRSEEHTS